MKRIISFIPSTQHIYVERTGNQLHLWTFEFIEDITDFGETQPDLIIGNKDTHYLEDPEIGNFLIHCNDNHIRALENSIPATVLNLSFKTVSEDDIENIEEKSYPNTFKSLDIITLRPDILESIIKAYSSSDIPPQVNIQSLLRNDTYHLFIKFFEGNFHFTQYDFMMIVGPYFETEIHSVDRHEDTTTIDLFLRPRKEYQ